MKNFRFIILFATAVTACQTPTPRYSEPLGAVIEANYDRVWAAARAQLNRDNFYFSSAKKEKYEIRTLHRPGGREWLKQFATCGTIDGTDALDMYRVKPRLGLFLQFKPLGTERTRVLVSAIVTAVHKQFDQSENDEPLNCRLLNAGIETRYLELITKRAAGDGKE